MYQPGDAGGVAMAVHNTRESIDGFARASFNHALQRGWPPRPCKRRRRRCVWLPDVRPALRVGLGDVGSRVGGRQFGLASQSALASS
jgi:hypothetical protein